MNNGSWRDDSTGLIRRVTATAGRLWGVARWRWLLAVGLVLLLFPRLVPVAVGDRAVFNTIGRRLLLGDRLYVDVWDNKDPLFFYSVALERLLWPQRWDALGEFLWISLICLGVWHWARALGATERTAWWAACIGAPLVVTGEVYLAGLTTIPGIALGVLAIGLAAREKWVQAGIVGGLLCFTKMILAPIALLVVIAVMGRKWRRSGRFFLSATIVGLLGLGLMAIGGILGPWLIAQKKNAAYSGVIVDGGFLPGLAKDLAKDGTPTWLVHLFLAFTSTGVVAIAAALLLALGVNRILPEATRGLLAAVVGTLLVVATTGIWPHHRQTFYLASVLVLGVVAALVDRLGRMQAASVVLAALVLGSFNPQALVTDWHTYHARLRMSAEPSAEGRALRGVGSSGDFARVGGVPRVDFSGAEDWRLVCPLFHHYAFTPKADLDATLACLPRARAIIVKAPLRVATGHVGWDTFAKQVNLLLKADYQCTEFTVETGDTETICVRRQR